MVVVVVVVVVDLEKLEDPKVNNTSRENEGVLKFILVMWVIKEYFYITGCHLT